MYLPRGKEQQPPLQLFALLPSSRSAWFKRTIAAAEAVGAAAVLLSRYYCCLLIVLCLKLHSLFGFRFFAHFGKGMTVTGVNRKYYFCICNLQG
jgi:hypothetical protein